MFPLGVLNRKIYWATLLELRFEGSNGSQVFKDSSKYNRTVNVITGTPIISTTNPLSGSSSLLLGTNGTISIPNFTTPVNTELRTIEFRIQIDLDDIAFNESQCVFIKGYASEYGSTYSYYCFLSRNASGTGGKLYTSVYALDVGTNLLHISIADLSANNHVAITRRSNGYFAYLNGVVVDSFASTSSYANNTYDLYIGETIADPVTSIMTNKFKGRLDNFKLYNINRYPNDFTPPA